MDNLKAEGIYLDFGPNQNSEFHSQSQKNESERLGNVPEVRQNVI